MRHTTKIIATVSLLVSSAGLAHAEEIFLCADKTMVRVQSANRAQQYEHPCVRAWFANERRAAAPSANAPAQATPAHATPAHATPAQATAAQAATPAVAAAAPAAPAAPAAAEASTTDNDGQVRHIRGGRRR